MKNLSFMWIVAILMLLETSFLLYCYYHIVTVLLFVIALLGTWIAIDLTRDYYRKK